MAFKIFVCFHKVEEHFEFVLNKLDKEHQLNRAEKGGCAVGQRRSWPQVKFWDTVINFKTFVIKICDDPKCSSAIRSYDSIFAFLISQIYISGGKKTNKQYKNKTILGDWKPLQKERSLSAKNTQEFLVLYLVYIIY